MGSLEVWLRRAIRLDGMRGPALGGCARMAFGRCVVAVPPRGRVSAGAITGDEAANAELQHAPEVLAHARRALWLTVGSVENWPPCYESRSLPVDEPSR